VTRAATRPQPWQVVTAAGLGRFGAPVPHLAETSVGPVVVRDAGGRGAPVVLLHGWCTDGLANYVQAFQPLAHAGFRPIAVDLPGHGASPLTGRFSFERCATAVADVIGGSPDGHLDPPARPPVVVGYSMGGPVSQTLARLHPGHVGGLVPIPTAAHIIPGATQRRLLGAVARSAAIAGAAGATLGVLLRLGAAAPSADPRRDLGAHVASTVRSASARALLEAAGELAGYDSRPWVDGLGLPAHSLVTGSDRAVPRAAQHELATALGASTTEVAWGHVACLRAGFGDALTAAVQAVQAEATATAPAARVAAA